MGAAAAARRAASTGGTAAGKACEGKRKKTPSGKRASITRPQSAGADADWEEASLAWPQRLLTTKKFLSTAAILPLLLSTRPAAKGCLLLLPERDEGSARPDWGACATALGGGKAGTSGCTPLEVWRGEQGGKSGRGQCTGSVALKGA